MSKTILVMYDHRYWKTRDPVRSPTDKPVTARPVLGWVTTGESLVLYIFLPITTESVQLREVPPSGRSSKSISLIGYGVAVTSMTLTHQPGVRLPVSETWCLWQMAQLQFLLLVTADMCHKFLALICSMYTR